MSNNIEKKRIIIVTQYFYPENFKSNDIAFELHKKGYLVDVLTSIPNYPEGKYYKGYNIFRKRIQKINGVRVYRALQIPRGKNNITLSLNYISFVIFASIWAFVLAFIKKYKCIIVHQPSPIIQGIPAIIIKKIQSIPIYFWVLDSWPDAIKSTSGISSKKIIKFIEKITITIYNNCYKILISSSGFRNLITKLNPEYNDKIIYFPNWSEDILSFPNDYQIPELPKGFRIMIAGNLGKSQDLESILKTANHLKKHKNIKWIFIGNGSKKEFLDTYILENNLSETVFSYGRYPFEAIPTFYSNTDALLLSLKGDSLNQKEVVPARLQSYMSSGKPIIGIISGGAAKIIKEANCGKVVESGQWLELANLITTEIITNLKEFYSLGANGRDYYEKYFTKEKCINNLKNILEQY